MKLSIIVPVYNVENYIRQCINSVLFQSFCDYELILVDDGSTDSSGRICDDYLTDSKVKVIHKKNGGLSSARNAGIMKASGDYLMFIDGDDFLYSRDVLKKIVDIIIQSDGDVVQFKILQYYEKHNKMIEQKRLNGYQDDELMITLKKLNDNSLLSVSACDKVVKRSIVVENSILFNEELLSEDIDWSLRLYQRINKLVLLDKNVYVYRQQRPGSITSGKKRVNSLFEIISYWASYNYDNDVLKRLYLSFLAYQYTILLSIADKNERKRYYGLKYILKYDDNYKVKKCNKIFSIFGLRGGILFMKAYLLLKNKGLIKL